jgi:hypothetical protein
MKKVKIFLSSQVVNLLRSPGNDSQRGGIDSLELIPGLLKCLQIRAQVSVWILQEMIFFSILCGGGGCGGGGGGQEEGRG